MTVYRLPACLTAQNSPPGALDARLQQQLESLPDNKTGKMAVNLDLTLGTNVVVGINVHVAKGLANGTFATVVGFEWPDGSRHAPPCTPEPITCVIDEVECTTTYQVPSLLPTHVLLHVPGGKFAPFPGLGAGIWPMLVKRQSFKTTHRSYGPANTQIAMNQFPIVPSYAVTDYRSQGQTFDNVYLGTPPSKAANLYVVLTRVRSRHGLWLQQALTFEQLGDGFGADVQAELTRLTALSL